jgi:uncharacterized membrane protein YqaE (UPF0057 family)
MGWAAALTTNAGKPKLKNQYGNPLHSAAHQITRTGAMIMDVIRIIISLFIPPLGAFLKVGIAGHFWLNILLTILGFIPGVIHAIWLNVRK